jgi:hypothetical protein
VGQADQADLLRCFLALADEVLGSDLAAVFAAVLPTTLTKGLAEAWRAVAEAAEQEHDAAVARAEAADRAGTDAVTAGTGRSGVTADTTRTTQAG